MLKALRRIFEDAEATTPHGYELRHLELAVASLLHESTRVDLNELPEEYAAARRALSDLFAISENDSVALLKEAYPDHGILGEEYGERGGDGPKWITDPIDGTKSFIRGIPFFAALVALEEDGEITTGAVYAPALDDLLYAQRGQGAFDRNGRLRVSRIDTVRRSMLVFGGTGVLRGRGYWPAFERLVDASGRRAARHPRC